MFVSWKLGTQEVELIPLGEHNKRVISITLEVDSHEHSVNGNAVLIEEDGRHIAAAAALLTFRGTYIAPLLTDAPCWTSSHTGNHRR